MVPQEKLNSISLDLTQELSTNPNNVVGVIESNITRFCQDHPGVQELGIMEAYLGPKYPKVFVALSSSVQRAALSQEDAKEKSPLDKSPMVRAISRVWGGVSGEGDDRTVTTNREHERFAESQRVILQSRNFLKKYTAMAADRFFPELLAHKEVNSSSEVTVTTTDLMIPMMINIIELLVPNFFSSDPAEASMKAKEMLLKLKNSSTHRSLTSFLLEKMFSDEEEVTHLLASSEIHENQKQYDVFTDEILSALTNSEQSGLLQHMVHWGTQSETPFSTPELKGTIMGMVIGGAEPISALLTQCLHQLHSPEVWKNFAEKVAAQKSEDDKLAVAISFWIEAGRIAPPALFSARKALSPLTIKGMDIPAGSMVINLYGLPAVLDENFAEDQPANVFLPGRDDEDNTTGLLWGYGTRRCPGMMYSWELGGRVLLKILEQCSGISDDELLGEKRDIFSLQHRKFALQMKKG
jgi:cytochrome P450